MADILFNLQKDGIIKKILYAGKGNLPPFKDGSRLTFHYKTSKCDETKTVLDDSRKHPKPLEIILGKKFKLEVWEMCLQTMKEGEVSEFICDIKHVNTYPLVAKSLRQIHSGKPDSHQHENHCCGMMNMAEHGLGHADLDELMKTPQPLAFTLELVKFEEAETFKKEVWTMSEDEKLATVPKLKEEGNQLYGRKLYKEAADIYAKAIGILEQLILKEKPGDEEWEELDKMKLPFLLNFSQCKLLEHDYYPVIEHTTTVLKREPENVKALFRRAKAHVGAWNPDDARNDFNRVLLLDPSLSNAVKKELTRLDDMIKQKAEKDKQSLKGMFDQHG
ncbi:AH receptor-interacting protein-like [Haliotis rufescens]|uniref:AH receptor-interacting protein-like n=1 Tax=Haliotis rufescens TaxID=6454 RepID=UPI001EB042F2|nr:AH receptor-interacting protein-like [Haliotis rufescens]